jgi:hypothetical protein
MILPPLFIRARVRQRAHNTTNHKRGTFTLKVSFTNVRKAIIAPASTTPTELIWHQAVF